MGVYMGIEWNDDVVAADDRHGKPTFAVGDRVRVIKSGMRKGGSKHGAGVGDIDVVTKAYSGHVLCEEWSYNYDEIQHAFQPGDRIRLTRTKGYYAAGDRGTVTITSDESVGVRMDVGVYGAHTWSFPYDACEPARDEAPAKPAGKEQPCIVAKVELYEQAAFGSAPTRQPLPSRCPHVHDTAASAIAEAERLARNNPGQQFDVYQRVTGRVAEQHIEMKEAA